MNYITDLRYFSRKLIRELGMLDLDKLDESNTPKQWHALIEIHQADKINISELAKMLLISISSASRLVDDLAEKNLITEKKNKEDKREKQLELTKKGLKKLNEIDDFSDKKIVNALKLINNQGQKEILQAIKKYGLALEKSRRKSAPKVQISTLPASKIVRKQIANFIQDIQINEFSIPVDRNINDCILQAEKHFHHNSSCNFWYAYDDSGNIIGSIGLKRINSHTVELKKLFVAKNYRGQNIAQELMKVAINSAKNHNVRNIILGTVSKLKAAQKFYQKYGFRKIRKNQLPRNFEPCPVDSIFFKGSIAKDLC